MDVIDYLEISRGCGEKEAIVDHRIDFGVDEVYWDKIVNFHTI